MAMDAIEMVTRLVKVVKDMTAEIESLRAEIVAGEVRLRSQKTTHENIIGNLCQSLERAQEIIMMLGEKSGDRELLKEARVYANAIGGVTANLGPKPPVNYYENPVVKKFWSRFPDGPPPAKAPAKPKAKTRTKPKGKR